MHQKHNLPTALVLSAAMGLAFSAPALAANPSWEASLTVVSQAVANGGDDSQLTSRVDINAEVPAGKIGPAEGRLFAHIRAGNGAAVGNGAFASSNAAAFDFSSPVLMQAGYQLDIPAGSEGHRIELVAGKIDPFNLFDGHGMFADESETFLNQAFVHNPLLDAGGEVEPGIHGASPGLRLAHVAPFREGHLTVSAGVFAAGGNGEQFDKVFDNAFSIAQVEYSGKALAGLEGDYRLYGWNNRNQQHRGWGLSLDQTVNTHVSVFARYGQRTTGHGSFDSAWTLGAQVNGVHWGRENDRVGLAYGRLNAVSGDSEKITEGFYAVQITDFLQITPSVQWIDNPSGTGANRTIYGVRVKAAI